MAKIIKTFLIKNSSTIPASGIWQPTNAQLTEDDISRFGPFNELVVTNNSASNIVISPSGDFDDGGEHCPAGGTLTWRRNEIVYQRPAIQEQDAAQIAANDIITTLRRSED